MDSLGMLNVIKQTLGSDEGYLVQHFEVALPSDGSEPNRELAVSVRDAGVPSGTERYVVTISEGDDVLGEAGPEATFQDALRGAHQKAKSHL